MGFTNRTEQRDHIFTLLGMLITPLRTLVYSENDVGSKLPFAEAEFRKELKVFRVEVERFCQLKKDYFFTAQYEAVMDKAELFLRTFNELRERSREDCQEYYTQRVAKIQELIRRIPCEFDPLAIDRGSPFQGYLAIRALSAGAASQLEIFDPYLGPDVFHRYLSQTNPAVSVTLVTDEKRMKGKAGQEIVSVSQLFAAERPTTYRLLVDSSLHDRHIRCDGKIFHVGGTFKDVGSKDPCSITPADSPSIAATLDGHIAAATEWFGPNQPIHRV